jgi:hypothetical protein
VESIRSDLSNRHMGRFYKIALNLSGSLWLFSKSMGAGANDYTSSTALLHVRRYPHGASANSKIEKAAAEGLSIEGELRH